jgi:adenine-specific DNA-methyltransferase
MLPQDLVRRAEARRRTVSDELRPDHRTALGQFFTPDPVAELLASLLELPPDGAFTVLDPGAGTGSLTAALVARVLRERPQIELHIVAFEIDRCLTPHLQATLDDCAATAAAAGAHVSADLHSADFIEWAADQLVRDPRDGAARFAACLMNPPYRKIGSSSRERAVLERLGVRVSNVYPAFLALVASLLSDGGQLSAITPRSFANGPYFEEFRKYFLRQMAFRSMHVFHRRGEVFADAEVLQENVVFHAVKGSHQSKVTLSASAGCRDTPVIRDVDADEVIRPDDPHMFVRIPIDERATEVAERIANLAASLHDIPLEVSTGRVVDFRVREYLMHDPDRTMTVPLIYPSHLHKGGVVWPLLDGRKPNALERCDTTKQLLLPSGNYVLVKRFTAKEEPRRVVAAVFRQDDVPSDLVAFENHLNVFHRDCQGLPLPLALGLAMYLNSSLVDEYVRQFSGHTQINATDLRLLRYPTARQLQQLGLRLVKGAGLARPQAEIDALVAQYLVITGEAESDAVLAVA